MSGKKAKELRRAAYNMFIVKRPKCSFKDFMKVVKKQKAAGKLKVGYN